MRRGVLTRTVVYRDPAARTTRITTRITTRKLVSQAHPHLAALHTTIEALDWCGPLHIESCVDGDVTNTGVAEYQALAGRHLRPVTAEPVDRPGRCDDGNNIVVIP